MSGLLTMMKMNLKLLLRNKGYLAFLIILPVVSVLMLNIRTGSGLESGTDSYEIHELSKQNESIFNVTNTKLNVKVYDCNDSELSNYVIEELAKSGSYRIYRYKGEDMNIQEARQEALNTSNHNVLGAVIYIPNSFETQILNGNGSNMVVFEATSDARITLLEKNLDSFLQSVSEYASMTGYNKIALNILLNTSVENEMSKEIVGIEVGNTLQLTTQQEDQKTSIGYSLAFLTIGFLFSGVFIAATIVEERQNRVYNRIVLSKSSIINYGLVKTCLIFITVMIQTGILAIGIKLFVKTDYGIPFSSYIFFVFGLGLIFNTFSVVVGIITNNVLTSNYIAFLVWCLSDLLAGLYFPLDAAAGWWGKISMMMPQRWVIKAAEMLMAGKSGVYSMYILVVVSYLIVISSVGFMGINIRKKE